MKILVTGATGFIGAQLVPILLKEGHTVVAVARDERRAATHQWFDDVQFISADLRHDSPGLFELFGRPEALIHLAWSGLPNYMDSFHLEENLPADMRFLTQLVQGGVRHIQVAGTCLEYGLRGGQLDESLQPDPRNPYAKAKDQLRQYLQELQERHDFCLQWARLFYMYGPGQNPKSLLAQLDRAIDNGETEFRMSGGEQVRDYLPVGEVARRLALLLKHTDCNGIVNICSGQPITVRRLVEQHLQKRGAHLRLNLGFYPYTEYEAMEFWGDSSKFDSLAQAPANNT